jgi:hypothetical protein
MAVLRFSPTEGDTVFLRNAILRMIVCRAEKYLTDPADIEDLEISKLVGAISFYLLDSGQSTRLVEAVYQGTQDLKREVTAGTPTEEPVRAGIQEKLDEILALIACFLNQDCEKYGRQGSPDG